MTTAPAWFEAARKEIGTRELPENRGPAIRRYIALAHCGSEGDPWCAIFGNAMLESSGIPGTRSPLARSPEHHPNFVKLPGPALGALAIFWRISRNSGLGHWAFYGGEDGHGFIQALGGNESDMVRNEMLNPNGAHFGLSGYYWPKLDAKNNPISLPLIGKLAPQSASAAGSGKVT